MKFKWAGPAKNGTNHPEDQTHRIRRRLLLNAVFIISFSLIAIEITFTRLLSVLLSYHYVFVVLSLALLGLGLGGVFVHLFKPKMLHEEKGFAHLAFFSSFFSFAISISTLFLVKVGYIPNIQLNILLCGLILLVPFFWAGVILAEVYRIFPSMSSRIYGVDLIGAALGSPVTILFLNRFGAISTNLILGVVASLAAVLFAVEDLKKKKSLIVSISCLLTLLAFFGINRIGFLSEIPIGKNPNKEIHDALSLFKGRIVESRWSAFGLTDLVAFSDVPDHMDIYLDGTAGSPMYKFGGDIYNPGSAIHRLRETFPGYFPFFFLKEEERDNALIIGPGGGRDILLAMMGGVREITAVEINQDLVEIVRDYTDYNGGIYTNWPNVQIVIDEGRHFLKRQQQKYDVIMLSLPVTNTSRSLEGFSLTENLLFTTESMINYLDHLTEEGSLIVVAHNDAEILRLLSISLCALHIRGVETRRSMKQIYITGSKGSNNYLVFVLRKRPFESGESLLRFKSMQQLGLDPISSYFPTIGQREGLNPALVSLSDGGISLNQLWKMVGERGYDITPVTDNSPFFYKIEIGIPKPVSFIFGSSLILIFLVIWAPFLFLYLKKHRRRKLPKEKTFSNLKFFKPVMLFSMIGIGFMLIEISLIQKFALFLGQPVLSLATLLFSLLGWAGVGSLWSSRFSSEKINRGVAITSLFVAITVLIYAFILPMLLDQLLTFNLEIRLLATIFILSPLGFLMGFPFPLGIRTLKKMKMEHSIPWMWGINGVGSVLGSALTFVIAISMGFTEALLVSGGCYFIVFIIFLKS